MGSQNPVGEHAVRQVGKIASPGRKAPQPTKRRAQACAQARCSPTKIQFPILKFGFEASDF